MKGARTVGGRQPLTRIAQCRMPACTGITMYDHLLREES